MKRVLAIFTFSLILVFIGGKTPVSEAHRSDRSETLGTSAALSGEGVSNSNGTMIRWTAKRGQDVVGFNIYRQTQGKFERINKAMIPGAYVSTSIDRGYLFEYFDRTGSIGDSYRIEVVAVGVGNEFSREIRTVADEKQDFTIADQVQNETGNGSNNLLEKFEPIGASRKERPSDSRVQALISSEPGVRIRVSKFGVFRVSRAQLEAAGFNVSAPSSTWQLYFHGRQQAISVGPGDAFIEFIGKGIDTPETAQNSYFLIAGTGAGKRMSGRVLRGIAPPVAASGFDSSYYRRTRAIYVTTILNGAEENYFGEVINNAGSVVNFDLNGVDNSAGNAEVTLTLRGLTLVAHQTKVVLNGVELGPIDGFHRSQSQRTYQVPASGLQESGNTLAVNSLLGGSDISFLTSISVKYKRKFKAANNELLFDVPNYHQAKVTGFSDRQVRLYDISDEDEPKRFTNVQLSDAAGSPGQLEMKLPAHRAAKMYALGENSISSVDSVTFNNPSSLSNTSNSANYLVISHPDFLAEANAWAAYRAGQGLQTMVVDVNDVFDEFNFGNFGAGAIRSFLQYAVNNWQTAPQYVLLLGDASYDSRNYEGQGAFNLVPVQLVDTLFEETGSDDSIADFDNDGLAEIAIGRIPARTPVEVSNALQKVVSFENIVANAPSRGVLCASDIPQGFDFQALCERLHTELPASFPKTAINRADTDAKAALLASMNTGKFLVNYSGHGSASVWAATSFFGTGDVPNITNDGNLSVFTMLTCLNGYFVRPVQESLSERILNSTAGGGVAVWSSSGSTTADVQEIMAKRFYNQLANGPIIRLGPLINDAKSTLTFGRDVRLSWVLLGDPGLLIKPMPASKSSKAGS